MENLYLIKCNEYYKIGIANDLQSRLASLQTGNPYPLVVEFCFQFPNAAIVEKVLHQRFANVRELGEWFKFLTPDMVAFVEICRALNGAEVRVSRESVNDCEIKEAEEIQKEVFDNLDKWDFAAMFADGWVMELASDGKGRSNYWNWRKRRNGEKGYIYGGRLADLPYSDLEDMRRVYRDGAAPVNTPNALVEGVSNAE
jgi:hypothetical protein